MSVSFTARRKEEVYLAALLADVRRGSAVDGITFVSLLEDPSDPIGHVVRSWMRYCSHSKKSHVKCVFGDTAKSGINELRSALGVLEVRMRYANIPNLSNVGVIESHFESELYALTTCWWMYCVPMSQALSGFHMSALPSSTLTNIEVEDQKKAMVHYCLSAISGNSIGESIDIIEHLREIIGLDRATSEHICFEIEKDEQRSRETAYFNSLLDNPRLCKLVDQSFTANSTEKTEYAKRLVACYDRYRSLSQFCSCNYCEAGNECCNSE